DVQHALIPTQDFAEALIEHGIAHSLVELERALAVERLNNCVGGELLHQFGPAERVSELRLHQVDEPNDREHSYQNRRESDASERQLHSQSHGQETARISLPAVLRDSRSRCASAAPASG